ncbi:MAG: MBL fold metallo-hydrolase [Anaerolineae bacterium]|nr:MBL fold metallo-hydrolase [Anaerolineae bacterium]
MLRERVAEDIFVFTSERYLQVTASAIITEKGAVVVDTLPFPQETREMKRFIEKRAPINYVIFTHHQPDHVYGAYLLGGEVIAHERCRRILQRDGERILKADVAQHHELAEVQIRLPEVIFERGEVTLHIGKKTLSLFHTPGHTTDSISVYVREDKVLIAGDLVMPVPYIVGGDISEMRQSLEMINELPLENIVQGHGEVLLRGEIAKTIESSLKYLDAIESKVMARVKKGAPPHMLRRIHIESCHKSRIPLNGMTEQLHQANMQYLYHLFASQKHVKSDPTV